MCNKNGAGSDGITSCKINNDRYRNVMNPVAHKYQWFSVRDCLSRLSLSVFCFYYLLLTQPLKFTYYTWRFNNMYYGWCLGPMLTCTLPVLPASLCVLELFDRVKQYFKTDWKHAGAGATFFLRPPHPVASICWDMWLNISMYTSVFLLTGTDDDGIDHGWYDKIANKHYWRELITHPDVGGRMPRTMFHWCDGKLDVKAPLAGVRIMSKLTDSYLGIGDEMLEMGKDFEDEAGLRDLLQAKYGDKEAIGTEFCVAAKKFGTHQLDVLTTKVEGKVQCVRVMYWGECTGDTSHTSTSAYMCDVDKETIASPARWYSPMFLNFDAKRIGEKIPGLQEVVETCIRAHEQCDLPWMGAVGWDVMLVDDGPAVFFEGNFACSRVRRHMFQSARDMRGFIDYFKPQFTDPNSNMNKKTA